MINEAIKNADIQTVAEEEPFKLKKEIVSSLLKNNIKIDRQKTMEKKGGGAYRSYYYDVDFFNNSVLFYTHESYLDINFRFDITFKGNKIVMTVYWHNDRLSYSTSLSGKVVKDFVQFIISSFKKAKTTFQKEEVNPVDRPYKGDIIRAEIDDLNDEIGDKFEIKYDPNYKPRGREFQLRANISKFNISWEDEQNRLLSTVKQLLSDPVVKRSLDNFHKNDGGNRIYYNLPIYTVLPKIKDQLLEAAEKAINALYDIDVAFSYIHIEEGTIFFSLPKKRDDYMSGVKKKKDDPKLLSRKEAIMMMKKKVAMIGKAKNRDGEIIDLKQDEFDRYMLVLRGVARPALKRFFKEPSKYI